jgi:hypothetical protein
MPWYKIINFMRVKGREIASGSSGVTGGGAMMLMMILQLLLLLSA